jgi:hypothetical protein
VSLGHEPLETRGANVLNPAQKRQKVRHIYSARTGELDQEPNPCITARVVAFNGATSVFVQEVILIVEITN